MKLPKVLRRAISKELIRAYFRLIPPQTARVRMRRIRRKIWDAGLQTAAQPHGESILEIELAAERESEWNRRRRSTRMPRPVSGSALENGVAAVTVRVQVNDRSVDEIFRPAKQAQGPRKLKFPWNTSNDRRAGLVPEIPSSDYVFHGKSWTRLCSRSGARRKR